MLVSLRRIALIASRSSTSSTSLANVGASSSFHVSATARAGKDGEKDEIAEPPPVPPSQMIPSYEEAVEQRRVNTVTPYEAREVSALIEEDWSAVAPGEEGVLAGTSEYFKGKTCVIARATNLTVQSADYSSRHWVIKFGTDENKWTNPLTGWTSSTDTLRQINPHMKFETEEQAVGFATRQGWDYEVEEDRSLHEESFAGKKDYGDNFLTQLAKSKIKEHGEMEFAFGRAAHTSAWSNIPRNDYGTDKWTDKSWVKHRDRLKKEGKAQGCNVTPNKDRFGVDK